MKIAFCNNNLSGFYKFRKDVSRYFVEKGCEVILLYPIICSEEKYLGLLSKTIRCIPIAMDPNGFNPYKDFLLYRELLKIYKEERPDIVFNYTIKPNIYSAVAANKLGIKVVSMMAGLGYAFVGNSILKKALRLFYKKGLQSSDFVIVLNQHSYDIIVNQYVEKDRLLLFSGGEGVNMDEYPYRDNKFHDIHFLMIARLLYDKGYQEFVDAAKIVKKQFPKVHFELLGGLCEESPTGVSKSVLHRDIDSGVIEYLGTTDDVPSIVLRDGVVVVVASYYMEGMNRALMESCSMGRPIITTSMPGCKEMVDDGDSGFCIEPHNTNSLANACIRFINMSEHEKTNMAKASYEKCRSSFDIKMVIKRYKEIVTNLGFSFDELQNLNTEL